MADDFDWSSIFSQYYNMAPQQAAIASSQINNPQPQPYYDATPTYQPQQLLNYPDSSYADTRGWSPDPFAYGNSGPALQGGDWGSVMSQGGLYGGADNGGNFSLSYDNPYGDLSGVQFSNPYGDLSGSNQFGNPYGDLSGVGDMATDGFSRGSLINPYGDLSGSNQFGNSYGDLSGSNQFRNPYGDLSGAPDSLFGGFQNSYQPTPPMPPPRPNFEGYDPYGSIAPDGFGRGTLIDRGYQDPAQSYQTPTTPSTFGGAPSDVAPMSWLDQSYMDQSQGAYGSLMGGNDYGSPSFYERFDPYGDMASDGFGRGTLIGGYQQPIDRSYYNPQQPYLGATGQDSFSSAPPMGAQDYFAQNIQQPQQTNYQSAFGSINPTFQPMPGDSPTKIGDRAPQMGGFVSYAAPQFGDPSQPSNGVQAINQSLFGGDTNDSGFGRNRYGNN